MADRLDLLAGVFGIGKEPSGTADPYGLRRAALGLLRITLARRYRLDLRDALAQAQKLHGAQGERGANNRVSRDPQLIDKVWGFLEGRLEASFRDRGSPDSIQAVLHTGSADVVALEQRLVALTQVREKNRVHFEATAATFKRIGNILAQAAEKRIAPMRFDPSALRKDEPAEAALAQALERSRDKVQEALDELFRQVLAWGGVITGEHGIGLAKKRWWPEASGETSRRLHQALKHAFDPNNILNPGKFLD